MSGRGGGPRGPPRGNLQGGGRGGRGAGGGGRGAGRGAGYSRGDGDSRGAGDRGRGRGDFRGGRGGGGGGGGGRYRDNFEGDLIYNSGEAPEPPAADVQEKENALIRPHEEISLSGLSLDDLPLPSRPSYGTKGKGIVLRTNYFKLLTRLGAEIYRYEFEISPQLVNPERKENKSKPRTVNRRKTRRLIEQLLASNRNLDGVATDYSKFLVSAQKLPLGKEGIVIFTQVFWEPEDAGPGPSSTSHKVKIFNEYPMPLKGLMDYISTPPRVTSSSFDKSEVIQALNLILTRTANESPTIYGGGIRNKFYTYPTQDKYFDLGSGLIAVKGFYTSVRTSTLRLLVNINVANAAFYPAINLLGLMRRHTPNSANDGRSGLEAFISRLKVSHHYIRKSTSDPKSTVKRVKTILGFAHPKYGEGIAIRANAHQIRFKCDELKGATVSIYEYFQRKYNIRLEKPEDPVINVGSKDHPSWVPPELCNVEPGQQYTRKLDENQTAKMIDFAVRKPAENARRIVQEGAPMMGLSEVNQKLLSFGVKVTPKMITVRGRVLPAGTVQYKSQNRPTVLQTSAASWDIRGKAFSDPKRLVNWTFIKFGDNEVNRQHVESFRAILRNSGMNSVDPTPTEGVPAFLQGGRANEDSDDKKIESTLAEAAKRGLKMLLVILPEKNAYIYSRIKFWAEVKFGIQTICCVGVKFREKGPQYWANIAHKFNLKLGGINQTLPPDRLGVLADGKTMLVGMDVTHPSPGSIEEAPSIAGIVASVDGRYGQWPASLRAQTGRKEMIDDLDEMFGERLDVWRKHNQGGLPSRIIVYRDGVSEGQYRTILQDELPQVQKACEKRYQGGKLPKISIIVCGKRHHTRFYPTREEDADGKQKNPPSGTVVDRGITMEKGWDFYLQAHFALQGTARPTHYVVIYDKNDMNADQMEAMTHNLCYLFGRATKAVSLCPPAYYADLLCERGRAYLHREYNMRDNVTVTSGAKFDWTRAPWLRGVHPSVQDSMFYI